MNTHDNYDAWKIQVIEYPRKASIEERLNFLLQFAVIAPSGHNSQPWLFKIDGNKVKFIVERSRSLEESDPSGRQLMISFGCALENLIIAAGHCGLTASVNYQPAGEGADTVLEVTMFETNYADSDHLVTCMLHRHTDRGAYKTRALNPSFVNAVMEMSSNDNMIFIIDNKNKIERLIPVVSDAQVKIMDSLPFRNELSEFVKSSYTSSKTGIPGFALGLPAPVSLLASWLVKKFNLARLTLKQDEDILRKTPAYMVIATDDDEKVSWIKAGQLFERVWLNAVLHGMVCSPMAAIVQNKGCRKSLQVILDTNLKPQVFFRIGYPEKVSMPTPRFKVEDLLINKVNASLKNTITIS